MSDKPDEIQWIDEIWETWRGRCSTSEEQEWKIRFDAIRALIEHRPEVSRQFIERWATILYRSQTPKSLFNDISTMMRELGYEPEAGVTVFSRTDEDTDTNG